MDAGGGSEGGWVIFTARPPARAAPITNKPTCTGFIRHSPVSILPGVNRMDAKLNL